MTNTFIKPSMVGKLALANLYSSCVMLPLVHRDYEREFVAGIGNTVLVRKPATFTATDFDRNAGISVQNVTETSVPVVLDKHKDISIAVTDHELTMDIRDFNEQIVMPAMEGMAQAVDQAILAFRDDVVQEVGTNGTTTSGVTGTNVWDYTNPRVTIDAERVLNTRKVPSSERFVVVGPTTKAKWLGDDLFTRADQRGDIRGREDAYLGSKIYGFEPYMTQNVTGGNSEVNVAFHRSAVAFVSRPLALPKGAASAEYVTYKGLGMRVVYAYDSTYKRDVLSMDMLFGVKTLDATRAVNILAAAS